MALGAQREQVMWLVLRRALVQTSPRDPLTIGFIAAVMIGVAITACVVPARRAMRLDPVSALRYE